MQGFARCVECLRPRHGHCRQVAKTGMSGSKQIKRLIYFSDIQGFARGAKHETRERWRVMISATRWRALMISDVRCYECSVRRIIRLSVPFSGTAVKHGKLPVSISSIIYDVNSQFDLTPVDPAGGHRYRNSIKTCESRVFGTRQTAQ